MVRASASQSIDLGFNPLVESYQKTSKNGIYSFPAWRSAFRGGCEEQAGKIAYCVFGQGTSRDALSLCRRQVAQFSLRREGWWQEGNPTVKQVPCYKNADIFFGDP